MAPNSSLLQWLATFKLDGQSSVELKDDAYYNLADGYVCARILNQISPQYFSDKWLDGIKPVPPNGSWRLRVSNLKRILQKIYDYASDLQSQQFKQPSTITPDVAVIAQNFDPDEISRLIQLILFCAINCDKKQDYIEIIRILPTQVKQDIKEAIEELLINNGNNNKSYKQKLNTSHSANGSVEINDNKDTTTISGTGLIDSRLSNSNTSTNNIFSPFKSTSSTPNYKNNFPRRESSASDNSRRNDIDNNTSTLSTNNFDKNETIDDIKQKLNLALLIKDEKAQACHELELKLEQLRLEKDQLAYENEKLINEKTTLSNSPRKLSDSRRQSQTILSSPLISSSTTSSSLLRHHHHQQQQNQQDFNLINDNCKEFENRLKNLQEDNTQSLILEQNNRLQSELNKLKEHIIKLESEKEDYRLKSEFLKEDLNKITLKHDELRSKADQAKRLQDELDEHKQISEKVVSYETMVDNLVKKNNDLKKDFKNLEERNILNKQKIISLEEENIRLTSINKEIDLYKKQLHEIQVKLSQETYRADKVEVEMARLLERFTSVKKENEKLYETTNQLMRKCSNNNNNNNSNSSNSIRDFPQAESPNNLNSAFLNQNLQQQQQQTHSSDNTLTLINRVEELQRQLFQKEQELMDSRTKYKNNIQKAKEVIKTLNNNRSISGSLQQSVMSSASSFNFSSLDESNQLKQRIKELEERLIETEREFYEFKKLKEIHERLFITAFYGLTTPMQWKNAEKRLERTTLTSPPNTASSLINHPTKHSH